MAAMHYNVTRAKDDGDVIRSPKFCVQIVHLFDIAYESSTYSCKSSTQSSAYNLPIMIVHL